MKNLAIKVAHLHKFNYYYIFIKILCFEFMISLDLTTKKG